jgi:Tol biopolymer transport system component
MTRPTRILTAVATGLVALASASTAMAAPRTERLAFGADVQGNVDVYTVRPDGSGLRRLIDSPAFDACARYSADGRWIAWCSGVGAVTEIWVMRADGRRKSQLTRLGGRMTFPDFSPDGRTVAFSGRLAGVSNNNEIYATSRQGDGLIQLTDDPAEDSWPAYSPDGRRIAFMSSRAGVPQIWVMNADGSNPTQVTADPIAKGQLPRWSPDGNRIAYPTADPTLGEDIWVIDVDGTDPTRLTTAPGREFGPDWSPDGKQLTYVDSSNPAQRTVMIMNADGTGARPVKPLGNQFVPSWQPKWSRFGL